MTAILWGVAAACTVSFGFLALVAAAQLADNRRNRYDHPTWVRREERFTGTWERTYEQATGAAALHRPAPLTADEIMWADELRTNR